MPGWVRFVASGRVECWKVRVGLVHSGGSVYSHTPTYYFIPRSGLRPACERQLGSVGFFVEPGVDQRCFCRAVSPWREITGKGGERGLFLSLSLSPVPVGWPARSALAAGPLEHTLDPGGNGCLRPVLKHGPRSLATARVRECLKLEVRNESDT